MVFFIRFASIFIYFFFSSFGQNPLLIVVFCCTYTKFLCNLYLILHVFNAGVKAASIAGKIHNSS